MKKVMFLTLFVLAICCVFYVYFVKTHKDTEYVDANIYEQTDSISRCAFYVKDTLLSPYSETESIMPLDGFVPNAEVAAKIAESIWYSIFGKKIYEERPYHVRLYKDSIWIVNGSIPPGSYGENAYIEILKKDGRILKVLIGC